MPSRLSKSNTVPGIQTKVSLAHHFFLGESKYVIICCYFFTTIKSTINILTCDDH